MKESREKTLKNFIEKIPFVKKINSSVQEDLFTHLNVTIDFDGLIEPLTFDVQIFSQYPFRVKECETIRFINMELITYNHVMKDGAICIHTSHNTDIEEKIKQDFNSLRNWIIKYIIFKETDNNYEHLIVEYSLIDDKYNSYFFTDLDYTFQKGEFGIVHIMKLYDGIYKSSVNNNYLVQKFSIDDKHFECNWSNAYKSYSSTFIGHFYFMENPPAKNKRFAFENWIELAPYISSSFLDHIYKFQKENIKESEGAVFPIFLGYNITENQIHWEVALLKIGEIPIHGSPILKNGVKTGKWESTLESHNIIWAITRNCSYNYFFGRGTLCETLINKNILIIGIGAIGSMIAKVLVKGGCRQITIFDYDVKEPENVCRSEYGFINGIINKVDDLQKILISDSPFVDVRILNLEFPKDLSIKKEEYNEFIKVLNTYDLVFDCTTDDDLMYLLESLTIKADIINLSITNHANEMVCAFSPNIYHFVRTQFGKILKNDLTDLYKPTGCWSPTFKASYNDINLLVQMTIKHLNKVYDSGLKKSNFVIKSDDETFNNLIIEEF